MALGEEWLRSCGQGAAAKVEHSQSDSAAHEKADQPHSENAHDVSLVGIQAQGRVLDRSILIETLHIWWGEITGCLPTLGSLANLRYLYTTIYILDPPSI